MKCQVIALCLVAGIGYAEPAKAGQETRELPEDLACKIVESFSDPEIQREVTESLEKLGQINVGQNQLRRAIVFLSDGDYKRFKELRRTFMGDPRDLLRAANERLVIGDYWFSEPFDKMGPVKE